MKNTRVPNVLTVAAAAVLAIGAIAATSIHAQPSAKKAGDAPGGTRPALTVTTTQPQAASLPTTLGANGSIAAWQEASIGAEVSGLRLAEVRVNVGDAVKRGQVLAVFAPETVEADLAVLRAQMAEAEASLADARANAERARTLQTSGALSAQQISQFLTGEQTAAARVDAARAQVRVQELRLRNTQVRAPDDGIISARAATVGAVLSAGTELFRLVRQGRLEWRAEVTADELGRIRPGTSVKVMPASLAPDAPPLAAKVRMIGPTVDPQTRTALVYVDLPRQPGGGARPGMFARGEFELGETRGLTVPTEAVVVRDGFSYVFRIGKDNRVMQTRVEIGRRVAERVEIVKGLGADAIIVAAGAGFLNDGDAVAVSAGAKAAAAAVPPAPKGVSR